MFMDSVGIKDEQHSTKLYPKENSWRTLITVLRDDSILTLYLNYMRAQVETIRSDASRICKVLGAIDYQSEASGQIVVRNKTSEATMRLRSWIVVEP